MEQQESKTNLQILYNELKKEIEGEYTSTGGFIAPSTYSYYMKAKALVDEAISLSKEDNRIAIEHVLHTFDKEVSYVKDYEGKRKTAKKRQAVLESLMRKATRQLYMDLCALITDN